MIEFKGKNVLITGGSRGIGKAAAILFAKAGANVCFTYEKNHEAAARTFDELKQYATGEFAWQALSSTDEHGHASLIREIVQKWGSLDVLVSNAGIWKGAKIDEMTLEEYDEMMEANMTGTFLASKHAVHHMKQAGSGSIVIISSTAGQRGEAEHAHYAASKGAQISFTKSLASELAPFGIRVNSVAPGWVATDMTRDTLEDPIESEKVFRVIPLRRVAQPEEIANAVLFLASPLASFITGEILNVNGGAVLCG